MSRSELHDWEYHFERCCKEMKEIAENIYDTAYARGANLKEQKTEWIYVSGQLPENKKDVIALLSSGRITKAIYNYHKLPFSNEPIGWGYVGNEGYIDFSNEEVIAWMPLPETCKMSEIPTGSESEGEE